jgi:hypothetical protein
MAALIVRMRVLAGVASRVWIAVSGILDPGTQHHLQQRLHHRVAAGTSEFYVDLRESRCADGVTGEDIRALFASCPGADFHLVGAPDGVRDVMGTDPRFTVQPDLESVWIRWSQDD